MQGTRCWQVDAFTDRPFGGNPAAICLLDADVPDEWMQAVAAEMNLSETAFVRRNRDEWELRWFTPTVEVDLCGHATLATAHALWTAGVASHDQQLRFLTKSGPLTCRRFNDLIELDFPALPAVRTDPPEGLLAALGIEQPRAVSRSRFDYLVELETAQVLRSLRPNFRELAVIPTRGVIVTAPSDQPDFDFLSRFFAPAVGIDEDPVCGSAHCSLAPLWADRLGKSELWAYQASARGGILRLRIDNDRIGLAGQAVTVWEGILHA